MEKALENKVAIVTGATSGIGKASAIALAKAGAKVVVSGRREVEGEETVRLLKKAGGNGIFVKTDVTKENDIAALVSKTLDTYGHLDIAFNNAGVGWDESILEITPEEYRLMFDTNVLGVALAMKYEVAAMLDSGGGSIINMASLAGLHGGSYTSLYSGSKHAVIGLTKSVALEYACRNIRANSVAPAGIETEMLSGYTGGLDTEKAKEFRNRHPMGRFGKPEEVASVVVFLASSAASFITAQTIAIDGGFTG